MTRSVRGAATVFSDVASVMGARIASMVLSLASVLLVTHLLKPAAYGALAFFTILSTLVFTITSGWTSTAVVRYGRELLERRGTMVPVTWARFVSTAPLFVVAAAVVVGLKVAGALPSTFTWPLCWLALLNALLLIVAEHCILLLEGSGRMKTSAVGMVAQQAVVVGATAVVVLAAFGKSPVLIASLWLGGMVLVSVVFIALVFRVGLWPPVLDRDVMRRVVSFSVPMIAFTLSQYVVRSVDLFVIAALKTATAVGVYAVAYQGYTVIQAIATAIPPVLTPLFVSLREAQREEGIGRYMERVFPQLTFLAALVAGIGAPFVAWIVPLVFGSGFAGAADPLTILLVPALLFLAANFVVPIIVLHERSREIGLINVAAAVVNVAGDVVLIGPVGMGIEGAAVATALALLVVFYGYLRVARRCAGTTARFNPALFAPLAAGVTGALALDGFTAVAAGAGGALLCAALVQFVAKPFSSDDAGTVEQLDMPPALKRAIVRGLGAVG